MNLIKELGIVDMGTYKVKKAVYACPKCGAEKALICFQVDTGRITQCRSCASKQQKQGHRGTRLYSIWQNMKARCKGSTSHNKKYYTDKGITVCDEWVNDFPAFKVWALQNGYDDTLVARAAGVTIKEDRKLILMVRETPMSAIHLENMLKLSRLGVIILPPVTEFYTKPKTIDDIVNHGVGKCLDQFDIDHDLDPRWGSF